MDATIALKIPEIKSILLSHGVEYAFVFGSAVKDKLRPESDVDFLIRFPKAMDYLSYADHYFTLANDLEQLLQRPVQLVAEETLTNKYFIESIHAHKLDLV